MEKGKSPFKKFFYGLIFVLGLAILLGFIFQEKPSWVSKSYYIKNDITYITLKKTVTLPNFFEVKKALKEDVKIKFIAVVYDKALKQIKLSYDWENLDQNTQKIVLKHLEETVLAQKFDAIDENSIYIDYIGFEAYGLYSMKNGIIDAMLQAIYEQINNKVIKEYM